MNCRSQCAIFLIFHIWIASACISLAAGWVQESRSTLFPCSCQQNMDACFACWGCARKVARACYQQQQCRRSHSGNFRHHLARADAITHCKRHAAWHFVGALHCVTASAQGRCASVPAGQELLFHLAITIGSAAGMARSKSNSW